jgi:hypothetical protein
MGDAQQAERAAFARQLVAVGRFTQHRLAETTDEHDLWCVDDWEAIAAEIGAELGISRSRGLVADALRHHPAGALPETHRGVSGQSTSG